MKIHGFDDTLVAMMKAIPATGWRLDIHATNAACASQGTARREQQHECGPRSPRADFSHFFEAPTNNGRKQRTTMISRARERQNRAYLADYFA